MLVRDPEFGAALADLWPREREAATRLIDLDPEEPLERQIATLTAGASAG
ncbi:MAG: hypothetical protein FJ029_13590 [Actinobacteria bacterium]|nr:hypothetical protein [Actinomycetota bacterium]